MFLVAFGVQEVSAHSKDSSTNLETDMNDALLIAILSLLVVTVILLIVIAYFIIRNNIRSNQFDSTITSAVNSAIEKSAIREHIGKIEAYAQDVRADHRRLDEMLRAPKERADIGEIMLENILADQLPQDMFGIRKRLSNGKIPDAHISSTSGIICIDSKFPLDNYRRYCETQDLTEKEKLHKAFIRNIREHLQKIAGDYITPDDGTVNFAFAYIQSEAVYYFMVTEAYELLQNYARTGVQVVSPLTLTHKIAIIRAGIHAKRLSEQAEYVHREIVQLKQSFTEYDKEWRTFFHHFTNAQKKTVGDLDKAYKKLQSEFDQIETNIEIARK
jgi:DNA recombination protein RmuC